ncbi:uncharacterized protein LOC135347815 isoform X2 [Halichondria panicea]|uniref:uncharacterized protein LOC135347815 isoform X2 n=1 Tax=Halichondria panicea TaxID=6063 RepID=UPI00312B322F
MAELEISRSGQTHADILHPLTSLEWEEWPSLPVLVTNASSVYLNGTLYVGGRSNAGFDLYSFKPGVDSTWTVTDTPTNRYTLVAHDSELLLVGGKEYPTHEITNKVFTMRDGQFVETLPPMKERRRSPSAVSSGSALVVAGGWNTSGDLSSVEVFKDVQWTTAPSLPSAGYNTKSALHGDQWYLITGQGKVFCASLQSLISGDDKSPWETLPDAPNRFSAADFFGGHLLSIGGGFPATNTTTIHAFSTFTQSWEHVADLALLSLLRPTAVVLSSKQLIVIDGTRVLHGKLKVTTFDADSHFTLRAIDRLKVSAGISVKEELVQRTSRTAFLAVAGVDVWAMYNYILGEWASRRGPHPPTWAELFRALKEMGLSELADRIEKYLRGSVPEDPPRPLPDEEGDSEEEKDDETPEQEILRLNNVLAEYINANIQLKKANNNLEQENTHLKSEKVKEEQMDPVSIKEEPTSVQVKSEEPVSQLLPLGLSTVQHHAIPFDLPGVEVVASTCVIVTNSPQIFRWVGYGFKLTIPQGSLPAGVDQCRLDIKASVAGQYQFPDNLQLVSGVIWIRPYPSGQFQQQLTVEIQHCAKMTSSTKLSFVRAHCSQESLPYTFKQLEGRGSFTEFSSYGSLELNQFSGLAVTGEDVERVYTASLYYLGSELHSREIHFVVNWDNEIHNTLVSEKYSSKRAVLGVNHFVEFEEDSLTLDIPMAGAKVKGGWKITPMFHPTVIKKHVDQFKPGQRIPYCHLKAEMTNKRKKSAPKLFHQVKLVGAKDPYNIITIDLDPQRTFPETTFGDLVTFKPAVSSQRNEARELLMQPQSHATHYPPSLGLPYYPVASHSRNMSEFPPSLLSVEQSHTSLTLSSATPPPPSQWNTQLQQWSQTSGSASGGWSNALNIAGPSSGSLKSIEYPAITLDQLVSRVGIDKDLLDKECSDGHLRRMSSLLPDWLTYAKALGFTEPETRDITDNPQLSNSTHAMKALRVLEKWHRRHGGHVTIATEICKMFKGEDVPHAEDSSSSRPPPITGEKREATEHSEQVPPKRPRSEEQ